MPQQRVRSEGGTQNAWSTLLSHCSTLDYTVMWQAIQGAALSAPFAWLEVCELCLFFPSATGRPMVLTTEGNPNNTACSVIGGCGNAKRVGHDIGDNWNNVRVDSLVAFASGVHMPANCCAVQVQSLIDIGSGLWPFAHNATNFGGWWNGKSSAASAVRISPAYIPESSCSVRADLDMMQVSRGDFVCAADAPNLARCRAHFTMWCIMKVSFLPFESSV